VINRIPRLAAVLLMLTALLAPLAVVRRAAAQAREAAAASFEDRFWAAKLESRAGRLEAAESAFVRLLEERPADYDSRIALADVRMWRGDRSGARMILEDLRRSHPTDPEVLQRWEALRRIAPPARWQADLEYYGERLPHQPATNGATLSLGTRPAGRLRWRAAGTVQEKFTLTEYRIGGEVGYRLRVPLELQWSAYLAPGAEVLARQAYGLGLSHKVAPRLVLYADYGFHDFADAAVHLVGPGLELYAGRHWLLAGRYRYSSTRFSGEQDAVGNHAGSLMLGYLYGEANLLRLFGATGAESFTQPSRELIGRFRAHTIGAGWRHFLTLRLGFEIGYAHQDRSVGAGLDSYSLRVIQRW